MAGALGGRYEHRTAAEYNNSVADSAKGNATHMQKYFGPLRNSDIDTFASDAFAHETHNLPRAYVGRNKFLMATIDFLITKDDDWYTRHVLPWLYTEELHVKWNIWRFNRTMMDYEPEQGVPRYVSYESESRSDSLVRRGLAFIIEHGFYKTELGRQHYLMNLKQIVEAVHETVYFGVMHELLAAPNFYQQWQAKHGKHNSIIHNDAVSALAEERWRFACVQKDIKGLFILDAEIEDRMRRVGIEPDSWIFPSKMAIYASMVPEYFNEFVRGGEKATTALEKGAKRFDTFRGARVFETRPFDTDFMSEGSIEPLMRDREIGEYYVLEPFAHRPDDFADVYDRWVAHCNAVLAGGVGANPVARRQAVFNAADDSLKKEVAAHGITFANEPTVDTSKTERDIQIFDMSQDKFDTVAYRTAMQHAWVGAADNSVVDSLADQRDNTITLGELRAYGMTQEDVGTMNPAGMLDAAGGPVAAESPCSTRINLDPNEPESWVQLARNLYSHTTQDGQPNRRRKLILPHKLLLFRPRQCYRMGTAILLKGGEELGQTLHGHHDFQLTDDVIHKTHIGHYTFYSKSVVREPKNMYMAEDVYCAGYNGGENLQFISEGNAEAEFSKAIDLRSHSLICIPTAIEDKTPACMSIIGDFEHHGMSMGAGNGGRYTTRGAVEHVAGAFTMGNAAGRSGDDLASEDQINGICFRGATRTQAVAGGEFTTTQNNTGHWGPSVYDGCASVRQGLYAHLRAPGSVTSLGY